MSFCKGEKETSKEKERKYLHKGYCLQADKKKEKKEMMEKKNAGICYLMGLTNIWGAALVVKLAISAAKIAFITISDTDIMIVKLGGTVRQRRF